jgi:hypothetical protein
MIMRLEEVPGSVSGADVSMPGTDRSWQER